MIPKTLFIERILGRYFTDKKIVNFHANSLWKFTIWEILASRRIDLTYRGAVKILLLSCAGKGRTELAGDFPRD